MKGKESILEALRCAQELVDRQEIAPYVSPDERDVIFDAIRLLQNKDSSPDARLEEAESLLYRIYIEAQDGRVLLNPVLASKLKAYLLKAGKIT